MKQPGKEKYFSHYNKLTLLGCFKKQQFYSSWLIYQIIAINLVESAAAYYLMIWVLTSALVFEKNTKK